MRIHFGKHLGKFISDRANSSLTVGLACPAMDKDAGDSGRDGRGWSKHREWTKKPIFWSETMGPLDVFDDCGTPLDHVG
jgi:hypothetical protein